VDEEVAVEQQQQQRVLHAAAEAEQHAQPGAEQRQQCQPAQGGARPQPRRGEQEQPADDEVRQAEGAHHHVARVFEELLRRADEQ
jgi:hypothetical protein